MELKLGAYINGLPFGNDLVRAVDIAANEVLQKVIAVETRTALAELSNPRPHISDGGANRDRPRSRHVRMRHEIVAGEEGAEASSAAPQRKDLALRNPTPTPTAPPRVTACTLSGVRFISGTIRTKRRKRHGCRSAARHPFRLDAAPFPNNHTRRASDLPALAVRTRSHSRANQPLTTRTVR
jgi:hypothetical protein